MTDPLNITVLGNATLNATNMVCGCIERSAAAYWGDQLITAYQFFTKVTDLMLMLAFLSGVLLGVILLLFVDWVYHRKVKHRE